MVDSSYTSDHGENISGGDADITVAQTLVNNLDWCFKKIVWCCALAVTAILIWIAVIVFKDAQPAIAKFGLGFIISREWNTGEQLFGGLPYIFGSIVSSIIALIFALPLGIAVAILTSENFLPKAVKAPIGFLVELIASIPSVIIGLWGIFVFIPLLMPLQMFLFKYLGWLPIFNTEPFGGSVLIAGLILAVMILPTIAAISRDVLLSIPPSLRGASMARGHPLGNYLSYSFTFCYFWHYGGHHSSPWSGFRRNYGGNNGDW